MITVPPQPVPVRATAVAAGGSPCPPTGSDSPWPRRLQTWGSPTAGTAHPLSRIPSGPLGITSGWQRVWGTAEHVEAALGEVDAVPEWGDEAIVDLVPVVRRVVAARVRDPHLVDDLVQETLARLMAARARVDTETLVPYAIVTARNLVASQAQRRDRDRRKAHLVAEVDCEPGPQDGVLDEERREMVGRALRRLPRGERDLLMAHEVDGADTASLAATRGSTAGAIAAQLSRSRAKLRVEVLLEQERGEPPTDRCRPVLIALSGGDRRRQRQLDSSGHLLECEFCSSLSPALLERRAASVANDEARVRVTRDADVVIARRRGREVAA